MSCFAAKFMFNLSARHPGPVAPPDAEQARYVRPPPLDDWGPLILPAPMTSNGDRRLTGMATFVCIHGAGGRASYWDLLATVLARHGHEVVTMDLPCEQEVGLTHYANAVTDAIGQRNDLVLVAQSLAGFVAPLVAERVPVEMIVLLAAMVPRPGESGHDWWANTGHAAAVAAQGLPDDSPETVFTHDVPAEVLASLPPPRDQTSTLFEEPWPLVAWPQVPTRFLACRDDRFFPLEWLSNMVRDRLGLEPTVVPGGHCAFLSQPRALAESLDACWRGDRSSLAR
jgi:pimeloyl-ACP methyl ester carboxylesterase